MMYFIISPYSLHASGTEPKRLKTIECLKNYRKTYNAKENHRVNPSCENVLSLKDTLSAYTKLTFASGENFPFSKKKTYTLL